MAADVGFLIDIDIFFLQNPILHLYYFTHFLAGCSILRWGNFYSVSGSGSSSQMLDTGVHSVNADPQNSVTDPGSKFFHPGSKFFHPGSRVKKIPEPEFLSKKIVLSSRNMIRESKGNTGICAFIKKIWLHFFLPKSRIQIFRNVV
jgi:hypothetical protein